MPSIPRILTTTALCLAAGVNQSCQSSSAEIPTERYVRQMPYSPERDAELEKSSREYLANAQRQLKRVSATHSSGYRSNARANKLLFPQPVLPSTPDFS